MAGWDDDDDLLDAMFDDGEDVSNASIADTSAIRTVGGNAVAIAIDVADNDGDDLAVKDNDVDGGGWGDDLDLDGLSSDENIENDDIVGGGEEPRVSTQPPPSSPHPPPLMLSPPPQQANPPTVNNTPPAVASSLSLHGKNEDDSDPKTEMEKTFAMFQEHEELMDKEIESIRNEQAIVASGNVVDAEEEWAFDDDSDIFNEDNDSLSEEDGGDKRKPKEEAPMVVSDQVSKAAPPLVPPPAADYSVPLSEQEEPSENPFLTTENNHFKDENHGPSFIPVTESIGIDNVDKINQDDGDGWSEEDFFEEDDMLSSSSKPLSPVPSPPLKPPTPHTTSPPPPIAQPTRAETATPQQQQHQDLSFAQPKLLPPFPAMQPANVAAFNPTQRRIYQMLSNYISTLHDTNFLSHIHQKLHLYQQATSSTNDNSAANSSARDLKTYYATRPGLRKYTLGVELDRMDYKLILANGKPTEDKDVIRSYFGVGEDGETMHLNSEGAGKKTEEDATTMEELLIRSANQSLLADMLVALTGSEEDIAGFESCGSSKFFGQDKKSGSAGLILSGPTLCMTSIAESCHFTVDLQLGLVTAVCNLAISVPFHPMNEATAAMVAASSQGEIGSENGVLEDGRLVLARANVSVRFSPGGGGGDLNDEPIVQYAVHSVNHFHSLGSTLLQQTAISLARDQHDHDLFQYEYTEDAQSTDARDRFLLSHHLLSASDSAALLAVSKDHIDKLKGVAKPRIAGFRSALAQLDEVTNVSAKLGGLSAASAKLGGLIDAVESSSNEEVRFPRSRDFPDKNRSRLQGSDAQQAPSWPPPHLPPHAEGDGAPALPAETLPRPRPIIGGLFMSGLSRLAAAATQPDGQQEQSSWRGGTATNFTPPPADGVAGNEHPVLYRREESEAPPPIDVHTSNDESRGYTGLTPLAAKQPTQRMDHFPPHVSTSLSLSPTAEVTKGNLEKVEEQDHGLLYEEDNVGWSHDEFDFEDEKSSDHCGDRDEGVCSVTAEDEKLEKDLPVMDCLNLAPFCEADESKEETIPTVKRCRGPTVEETAVNEHSKKVAAGSKAVLPIPSPPTLPQREPSRQNHRTFEEEFVIVLKEKIEAECEEMRQAGRMKRWTPLREDIRLRKRLMEVMISQINS